MIVPLIVLAETCEWFLKYREILYIMSKKSFERREKEWSE